MGSFGVAAALMSGTIVLLPVPRWGFPNTTGARMAAAAELVGDCTKTEPWGFAARAPEREQPLGFFAATAGAEAAIAAMLRTTKNRVSIASTF